MFYDLFSSVVSVVVLTGAGLVIFFLCGAVGMDGLFAASQPRGTLTCWHCGEQTRAGRKTCQRCGKEL